MQYSLFQYQMDDLKEACQNRIKEITQIKELSVMSAFLVANKLGDQRLKQICLDVVAGFVI
jgi:hypothetical protein